MSLVMLLDGRVLRRGRFLIFLVSGNMNRRSFFALLSLVMISFSFEREGFTSFRRVSVFVFLLILLARWCRWMRDLESFVLTTQDTLILVGGGVLMEMGWGVD